MTTVLDEDIGSSELEAGHLSAQQAIGLSVASFIPAVGLATVPAFVAAYAGRSAWLSMLAAVLLFTVLGLFVNVFVRRYVATGSLYSYIHHVFGPWSKLAMAAALVPGYLVTMMSLLTGFGLYLTSFLAGIGVTSAGGFGVQAAMYVVATLITAGLAHRGLDVSVRATVLLTVVSVPVMLLITVATVFGGDFALANAFSLDGITLSGFLQGLAIGSVYLTCFESIAALAAETKDPNRVVPRAIMVIPLVLGGTYLLATVIQVPALLAGSDRLAAGGSPPAVLAEAAGLGFLSEISDVVIAVAVFASLTAFFNYASRVLVTVAHDGLLPHALTTVHRRYKTPTVAIFVIALTSITGPMVLQLVSDDSPLEVYSYIATLVVYFWVVPYVLICLGAAVLLHRSERASPFVGLAAALTSAAVVWLYVNGIVNPGRAPLDAMPYVFAVSFAIFLVAFAVSAKARRRATAASR